MSNGARRSRLPAWARVVLIGRRPKRTLIRVCVLIVVCLIVRVFVLLPVRIHGGSMLPTYHDQGIRKINFVNRLAYARHEPRRGDVVLIRISGSDYSTREILRDLLHGHLTANRLAGPSAMLLKRIVGLPGETVEFANGRLLVDGNELAEPYVKLPCNWNMAPRKLGPGQYFVVGDNRSMPMEFHEFGVAARERIIGRILL
jgi:signal peptidase I